MPILNPNNIKERLNDILLLVGNICIDIPNSRKSFLNINFLNYALSELNEKELKKTNDLEDIREVSFWCFTNLVDGLLFNTSNIEEKYILFKQCLFNIKNYQNLIRKNKEVIIFYSIKIIYLLYKSKSIDFTFLMNNDFFNIIFKYFISNISNIIRKVTD